MRDVTLVVNDQQQDWRNSDNVDGAKLLVNFPVLVFIISVVIEIITEERIFINFAIVDEKLPTLQQCVAQEQVPVTRNQRFGAQ